MTLVVRIKPRAQGQIEKAAEWWAENRPAAPGAIRSDLKAALDALVEQPGIGTRVETSRAQEVRRLYLTRVRYFVYYRIKERSLEVVAFWHASRETGPVVGRNDAEPALRDGRLCASLRYARRRRSRASFDVTEAIYAMTDLKSKNWIVAKGVMSFGIAATTAALIFGEMPSVKLAALLVLLVWAACRFYYFLCYVLEHYVDPTMRDAGLGDLMMAMKRRRHETRRGL